MSQIVNLRSVRKKRARAEAESKAVENRVRFGMSKQEREAAGAARETSQRRHDAHRRENGGDETNE
ncbi:MAG: DUF4169 domain-containing protein [Leifsonia xyli]|nr:MAG: DUF4169 domain-containing protein [Leifsonia xyli]